MNAKFRWSEGWQKWVPVEQPKATPAVTPTATVTARRERHESSCMCTDCWNAGQRYGEYLKTKRLEEL